MKSAIRKTLGVVKLSVALYAELAASALRIVPAWR